MRRSILTAAAVAGLLLASALPALANGDVRDAWLAAYPDVCPELTGAANDCSLCHSGGLNSYGDDLAAGDPMDPVSIEGLDSDGDGRTNGEEINLDCSLPGDQTSASEVASWSFIKKLFE